MFSLNFVVKTVDRPLAKIKDNLFIYIFKGVVTLCNVRSKTLVKSYTIDIVIILL